MRIAIVGSRNFIDYEKFCELIKDKLQKGDIIVSGGANGVDQMARRYALENLFFLNEFQAEWEIYGKLAGPMRNKKIIDNSDKMIAIIYGNSKGTRDAIDKMQKAMKPVEIIDLNQQSL